MDKEQWLIEKIYKMTKFLVSHKFIKQLHEENEEYTIFLHKHSKGIKLMVFHKAKDIYIIDINLVAELLLFELANKHNQRKKECLEKSVEFKLLESIMS